MNFTCPLCTNNAGKWDLLRICPNETAIQSDGKYHIFVVKIYRCQKCGFIATRYYPDEEGQ